MATRHLAQRSASIAAMLALLLGCKSGPAPQTAPPTAPAKGMPPVLPDRAKPKVLIVDAAQIEAADKIDYRTLTREDFRGASMPPQFGDDPNLLAAATCVYVLPKPGMQMATRPTGPGRYEAQVLNIGFVAQMDRNCSWWNPRQRTHADYVLQHEQIHFAIFEVHARRMNALAEAISAATNASGDSQEAAGAASEAKFLELLREHQDEIVQRSLKFDQETSAGHDAVAQQRWYDQLQRELSE